jgi:hypothetical protein
MEQFVNFVLLSVAQETPQLSPVHSVFYFLGWMSPIRRRTKTIKPPLTVSSGEEPLVGTLR